MAPNPSGVQVDFLSGIGTQSVRGSGGVAARLLASNFNTSALRTNDILRKDEWIQYDQALVDVARVRLGIVEDLMSRGLRFPLTNALAKTRLEWERISDMEDAEISMAGVTESEYDRVVFDLQFMPIPIVHKSFTVNIRHLEASRTTGEAVDVTQARLSMRKVAEFIENMFVNGSTFTALGGSILGFTTAPNRNTGTGLDWSNTAGVTGEQIVQQVLDMMAALEADNFYGPYGLYIPQVFNNRLQDDYKANSDRTIAERIAALDGLSFVRPTTFLAANNAVMLQLSSDVVDVIDGMQPRLLQWDTHGGLSVNFKVMSIILPRMRSDILTQSGVAHFS